MIGLVILGITVKDTAGIIIKIIIIIDPDCYRTFLIDGSLQFINRGMVFSDP